MSEKGKAAAPARQCLYRGTASEIFTGDEAIEAALKDGWHDHPDKALAEMPDEPEPEEDAGDRLAELHIEHAQTVEALVDAEDNLTEAKAKIEELDAAGYEIAEQLTAAGEEIAELTQTLESTRGELAAANDHVTALGKANAKLEKAAKK